MLGGCWAAVGTSSNLPAQIALLLFNTAVHPIQTHGARACHQGQPNTCSHRRAGWRGGGRWRRARHRKLAPAAGFIAG